MQWQRVDRTHVTLHASEEEKKCGSVPMHAVEGVTFHVRSFARPSCLDATRIRERFMGHILLKNWTYTCSKNGNSGPTCAAVAHDARK